jgi:hypothetical protein
MVQRRAEVCQVRLALVEPVVDFQVVLQHTAEWLARDQLMIDMLKSIGIIDISRRSLPAQPEYFKASRDAFSDPNAYPVDSRGLVFIFAFFTPKHLGEGQFYLLTIKDKDGQNLDGSKRYRLIVSANAPVNQYWSATVYDRATHGLIRDMPRSGRGSQSPGLHKERADGSADIYFGPTAQAGTQFEVLFRFYGPEKPLFDKTWKLPDVEKVDSESGGRALQ